MLQLFFKSMSAGVLTYISVAEIFSEEFSKGTPKTEKYFSFCVGVALMMATTILFAE